ncbi:hypothetical protein K7640_06880 [Micromonospora sp. PLK6-60]|uniref:hypothetical protein n=1 Tax=Micromonospora sp. PLK6-60 TaxID=2873383 RepID=UPI001CA73DF9|nr:hypothetical protein [Micromonospora sp. PLK6-60]MBY8871568.1 hypothetical protein [Micromonospora sp. PLK6-60]
MDDDADKKVLRLIGYWTGPGQEDWPDPAAFVDRDADPAARERVVAYLRAGTTCMTTTGTARCRLCGEPNGSAELTDGRHFVWPEGLAHYVEAHHLRLPDEVVGLMDEPPAAVDPVSFERDLFDTGRLAIDDSWWLSAGRPVA